MSRMCGELDRMVMAGIVLRLEAAVCSSSVVGFGTIVQ